MFSPEKSLTQRRAPLRERHQEAQSESEVASKRRPPRERFSPIYFLGLCFVVVLYQTTSFIGLVERHIARESTMLSEDNKRRFLAVDEKWHERGDEPPQKREKAKMVNNSQFFVKIRERLDGAAGAIQRQKIMEPRREFDLKQENTKEAQQSDQNKPNTQQEQGESSPKINKDSKPQHDLDSKEIKAAEDHPQKHRGKEKEGGRDNSKDDQQDKKRPLSSILGDDDGDNRSIAKTHTEQQTASHPGSVTGKGPGPDEKCTPWEISLDDWWQDHPAWEASFENDTHACFRPIQNGERVQLLEKAHALQFNGCTKNPAVRNLFQMGFAANFHFVLGASFWSAFREDRQFLPGIEFEGFRWLYEPDDENSWASCPTHDHECLFLPISNCPRPVGREDEKPKKKYQFRELEMNQTLVEHNIWLTHYLMRPRQIFRKKIYEFIRDSKDMPRVQTPCTWIHVRRADAMSEKSYKRNFYLLKEYLTRGKISKEDNVLLLTDDQSTIEEARLLHPEYKWAYWDRKRHRGPAHYNTHIPSGDHELEILTIMAERHLAKQCRKGVFGNSNMATMLRNAMAIEHPGGLANLTLVQIDRRALRKTRIEPEDFVKDLDKKLEAAREKLANRTIPLDRQSWDSASVKNKTVL